MNTVIHIPSFIEDDMELFNSLLNNIEWTRVDYFKRKVCHYSGENEALNKTLMNIAQQYQRNIDGAFLNLYEDGNDYAPYHADKYNRDTCLISLGTTRILRYKHNETKENTDYDLHSGDILFIPDETNRSYKHSLLKRTKMPDKRISILVFFEN
jgi:alkylated DNA repair dioxygenase AlkB